MNAVPVKNKEEADLIKKKYNHLVPIILPEKEIVILHGSPSYNDRMSEEKIVIDITLYTVLTEFLDTYRVDMGEESYEALEVIREMSKKWN